MAINRDKILKGAEKLVQKGKIEPAIREYEKLLKLNPDDVNTINRIGDLHNRIGQVDRAVELYQRIADSFAADGFVNKAIAIYKKINRLAPDKVEVFERLADLYIQQGLVVEAKDQFSVLADWYLKNNDLENAIQIQRKLIQIDPENHMGHLRLADLLFRKGDSGEAIDVYQRLGTMLLDRGKVEEAERLYRHALDQDPPSGEFLMPICEALVDSGKISVAREFLIEAQKRSPNSTAFGILDLKVMLVAGETKAAAERAQALLEAHPTDEEVGCLAGRALFGVGDLDRGRDLLLPIANRRLDEGDRLGAQEVFRWLTKSVPTDRGVQKLGIQALSPTDDKEMVFTLKAALADGYFQDGERDEARRVYADLIREDPDNKLFQDRLRDLGVDIAGADQTAAPPVQAAEPEPPIEEVPILVVDVPDEDVLEIDADEFEVIESETSAETLGPQLDEAQSGADLSGVTPNFDPLERLAEANVFAKYGLVDKALNHLETIIHYFPENLEVREKLVSLALEADRADLAAREVGPLVETYKKEGAREELEKLERALPGLIGPAEDRPAEVVEAVDEEQVQVEIVEVEEGLLVSDDGLDFSDMPSVDEFEAAAASGEAIEGIEGIEGVEAVEGIEGAEAAEMVNAVESFEPEEDIEEIELEAVDVGSFEARELGPVKNGIEFEEFTEADLSTGLDDEPAIEVGEPQDAVVEAPAESLAESPAESPAEPPTEPPTEPPADSLAAADVLDDLEQVILAGGSLAGRSTHGQAAETPIEEVAADSILDEAADRISGPTEGDLRQMDSFLENSLYEDATRLMRRLEAEYPQSSEVAERKLELKAKGFLTEEVPQVEEASADLFVDEEEGFVDLAAELEEEMAAEEAIVEQAAGPSESEVNLEDVFREFQKGVAEQLSEEDADTHFNLGIAYKEMGLLPEAIREFQVASKDPDFYVECCSMIGVCYVDQAMWEQAAGWYQQALEAPLLKEESVLALKYELANCLEGSGDLGGAAEFFEEIMLEDPAFRDINSRVDGLTGHLQPN